jgi:hypothetical protein
MRKKVKFQCGVFIREVLGQLARLSQTKHQQTGDNGPSEDSDGGKTV